MPLSAAGAAERPAPTVQAQSEKTVPAQPERLDQRELTKLEAREEQPGPEVAGGALTTQQLTYIVIALAAAVIVLVLK